METTGAVGNQMGDMDASCSGVVGTDGGVWLREMVGGQLDTTPRWLCHFPDQGIHQKQTKPTTRVHGYRFSMSQNI